MEQDRAFGTLEIRAVDDATRTFTGIANSVSKDLHGTNIDPAGAVYELPLPLFFHDNGKHSQAKPIGDVIESSIHSDGKRWVTAQVPEIPDDGTEGGRSVKARVDSAWADIKNKLVRGLSIDFQILKQRGSRISEWRWLGLSVVPIPSNQDATIMSVRSAFAASGGTPGVSGTQTSKPRPKMTIQDQITQFENTRAAKVAQRDALIDKSGADGTTLDESQQEQFDTLDGEIKSIDGHLIRLATVKSDTEKRAVVVDGSGTKKAADSRSGVAVVKTRENAEKGIGFARHVMALVACKGNTYEAAEYVKRTFPEGDLTSEVVKGLQTRAAVAAGTTTNATFAAPLVNLTYLNEFLEILRPATIIGRMTGIRRVPFNVSLPMQTAGGTYSWVGQGVLKPVTNLQLSAVSLAFAKAAGIIVISKELARLSTPSAQQIVRDELIAGMRTYLDTQFIDPAVAAVANVNPASISNGVAGTAAGGTAEANARADLRALINGFNTGNYGLGGVVLLMGEGMAFTLGTVVNAIGAYTFPGLTATGGSIYGLPVITSNILTTDIYAVHAPSILLADEDGLEIDVSDQATLIMDSAPAAVVTPAAGAALPYTNLWQANLIALRAERLITWAKARTTAVRRITGAAYV